MLEFTVVHFSSYLLNFICGIFIFINHCMNEYNGLSTKYYPRNIYTYMYIYVGSLCMCVYIQFVIFKNVYIYSYIYLYIKSYILYMILKDIIFNVWLLRCYLISLTCTTICNIIVTYFCISDWAYLETSILIAVWFLIYIYLWNWISY